MAGSSSSNGGNCTVSGTRSEILALRNSSQLDPECHYIVTDYNRNNVGQAEILLHAVNENTLSKEATVNTTYDNISWEGTYDIDANRIESLHDNLGNDVYGQNSVDSFPWGNTAVTENTVREGTLNWRLGTVSENYIGEGANLTISGGRAVRNRIETLSNLTITEGVFEENIIDGDSTVNIGSGTNIENRFGSSSTYTQDGSGYIRYSEVMSNSIVTNGDTNISNCTFKSATNFNSSDSSGSIANSEFSYMNCAVQRIDSLTISQCGFTGGCQISANSADRLYLYRCSGSSGGRFLVSANRTLNASYSEATSYGYIQVTQGVMTCNYSRASNLGYISHQSSGTNTVDRSEARSQANIRFLNSATGGRVYYCTADSGASIYQSGSSTGCYQYYCTADSLSQMYVQNSVNARHYYNNASGYSYIRKYGNGGGQSIMYYCTAHSRGYVDHTQLSRTVRFYSVNATSQSIARQTGNGNCNLYYSSFSSYYYAYLTMNGVTRTGLHGYGRQTFNGQPATNGTGQRNW